MDIPTAAFSLTQIGLQLWSLIEQLRHPRHHLPGTSPGSNTQRPSTEDPPPEDPPPEAPPREVIERQFTERFNKLADTMENVCEHAIAVAAKSADDAAGTQERFFQFAERMTATLAERMTTTQDQLTEMTRLASTLLAANTQMARQVPMLQDSSADMLRQCRAYLALLLDQAEDKGLDVTNLRARASMLPRVAEIKTEIPKVAETQIDPIQE